MSEERRKRAPALATRVDDVRPDQKDWAAPSTARSSCLNCGTVLPEAGAKFCPECGKNPSLVEGESSIYVDEQPVGPTAAHVVVEVRTPAPAAPAAPQPAVNEAPKQGKRKKGLPTMSREADELRVEDEKETKRVKWVFGTLFVLALIAGLFGLGYRWFTSHSRSQPDPLPVSTMPISVMPYDAGTD